MNFAVRIFSFLLFLLFLMGICDASVRQQYNLATLMDPSVSDRQIERMSFTEPKHVTSSYDSHSLSPSTYHNKPRATQTLITAAPRVTHTHTETTYITTKPCIHTYCDHDDYDYWSWRRRPWYRYTPAPAVVYIERDAPVRELRVLPRRVALVERESFVEPRPISSTTKMVCGTIISLPLMYWLYQRYYVKPFADDLRCLYRTIRVFMESPEALPPASHALLERAAKTITTMSRAEVRLICAQLRALL